MVDSEEIRTVESGGGGDGGGPPTHAGGGGPTTHAGGGDGGGPPTHAGGALPTITINNKEYQADKPSLTGTELKRLAGEPPNRVVMWIKKEPGVEEGTDVETILDDQSVNLVAGMKFRIVNAGTFG